MKNKQKSKIGKKDDKKIEDKNNLETGIGEVNEINPKYDEIYLQELIDKAKETWKGIDADKWLRDLRGDYEDS